jgi:hypothetical protein
MTSRSFPTGRISRREALGGLGLGGLGAATILSVPAHGTNASLDVRGFGAKGDGVADDTAAIRAAAQQASRAGTALLFPAGTYNISGWRDVGSSPILWRAPDGARIQVHDVALYLLPPFRDLRLTAPVARLSTHVPLADTTGVAEGMVFFLSAQRIVDRVRPDAPACQTALVKSVTPDGVELDRPLHFSYTPFDPKLTVRVYGSRTVAFEGITFVTAPGNRQFSVECEGLKGGTLFSHCGVETLGTGDPSAGQDGVMLQASVGVGMENMTVNNCRYGLMFSRGARGCTADGVVSAGNRHPLYAAYWADSCVFSNVKGTHNVATVDCHSSFDIVYQDVQSAGDEMVSNMRSAGATLLRARLNAKAFNPFMIAFDNWAPDCGAIGSEHDVTLRDVTLTTDAPPIPGKPGIDIRHARHVVIENVTISPGGLSIAAPRRSVGSINISGGNLRAALY